MKLGTDFPQEWKNQSEKSGIAISDILYAYAVEDLMTHIEKSSFGESLWLTNEDVLSEDSYRKNVKDRLSFYYMGSSKMQQDLELSVVESFAREVVQQVSNDIIWTYYIEEKHSAIVLNLEAHYLEMCIPVVVWIEAAPENAQSPKWKEIELPYIGGRTCRYLSYSKESVLAEALFEMLRKLELVADMEVYRIANDILKTYPINGRHILEEFRALGEKEPKVVSLKRLEQIESYRSYAYMKRKWQQYEKRHEKNPEAWEQVLERILKFLRPTWTAFCENEIFFDDWMPELGRFLD